MADPWNRYKSMEDPVIKACMHPIIENFSPNIFNQLVFVSNPLHFRQLQKKPVHINLVTTYDKDDSQQSHGNSCNIML